MGRQAQNALDQPFEPVDRQGSLGHTVEADGQIGDRHVRVTQEVLAAGQLHPQASRGGQRVKCLLVPLVLFGPSEARSRVSAT